MNNNNVSIEIDYDLNSLPIADLNKGYYRTNENIILFLIDKSKSIYKKYIHFHLLLECKYDKRINNLPLGTYVEPYVFVEDIKILEKFYKAIKDISFDYDEKALKKILENLFSVDKWKRDEIINLIIRQSKKKEMLRKKLEKTKKELDINYTINQGIYNLDYVNNGCGIGAW